jgi:hypothetical protein
VKTPAMPVFVRNRSMESCTAECRSNCSCTTYAYTNLSTALSGGDVSFPALTVFIYSEW